MIRSIIILRPREVFIRQTISDKGMLTRRIAPVDGLLIRSARPTGFIACLLPVLVFIGEGFDGIFCSHELGHLDLITAHEILPSHILRFRTRGTGSPCAGTAGNLCRESLQGCGIGSRGGMVHVLIAARGEDTEGSTQQGCHSYHDTPFFHSVSSSYGLVVVGEFRVMLYIVPCANSVCVKGTLQRFSPSLTQMTAFSVRVQGGRMSLYTPSELR